LLSEATLDSRIPEGALEMAKQVQWLSDDEWARIEPLLPRGRKGAHRVDDRRVISGIVHMLKSGARWRDCPPEFGPYITVYNRFNRWSRRGFWLKLLDALVDAGVVARSTAIDSTYVKAQRAAFGGKGGVRRRRSVVRAEVGQPRSTRSPTPSAGLMR
jgi:transposase